MGTKTWNGLPMTAVIATRQAYEEIGSPDVSHIVTEDDTPVDNFHSEKNQRLLTEPLYSSGYVPPPKGSNTQRIFLASSNVGLFTHPKEPPLVPDVMFSLDVQPARDWFAKKNRTYFAWELGKLPEIVIELVSNTEGEELGAKRRKYGLIGIQYYAVFDQERLLGDVPLRIFHLRGDLLVPARSNFFPEIGLGLTVWHGTYEGREDEWLRWCDANGALIPTGAENVATTKARADAAEAKADAAEAKADAAEAKADAAEAKADAERQRAEAAAALANSASERLKAERERAEKLAAKLRALGIEPE